MPGIHILNAGKFKGVDGRDAPGRTTTRVNLKRILA